MIRNERQYKTSLTQRSRLAEDLTKFPADADNWAVALTRTALESQIAEMDGEIADFEQLRTQPYGFEVNELHELPKELVRARIARNLSQRDLADKLGLKEQQVQRYEATAYAGASIGRLDDVMKALEVQLMGELVLNGGTKERDRVNTSLRSLGLSAGTIKQRFFASDSSAKGSWMNAAARASRIFDASLDEVMSGSLAPALGRGSFRAHPSANREKLNGYARYAEYLAELASIACRVPYRALPTSDELRDQLGDRLTEDPLGALLQTCWEHGIPVIPLSDKGNFYGACWAFEDRPAIVLKNATRTPERWSFVLAHEMDHTRDPHAGSVLESDLSIKEWRTQPSEEAADLFAQRLLLGDQAESMAQVAVEQAHRSTPELKSAVADVAEASGVAVGLLADYVAHRVSSPTVNWWPTANRLHSSDVDAWQVTRSALFAHIDLSVLDTLDRDIFIDGMAP